MACASLAVAIVALVIAWYAIKRANKTTSAATMVTLNEGFRSAWTRFFAAEGADRETELAELLNLFEIACAICLEGSLSGNSAVLIREYLNNVLRMLAGNDYARTHVDPLLQDANTFIFIKRFLKSKRSGLSVTIPPEWYEN
jgi:hypothetical protein